MRALSTAYVLAKAVIAGDRRPTWDSVRETKDPYEDLAFNTNWRGARHNDVYEFVY